MLCLVSRKYKGKKYKVFFILKPNMTLILCLFLEKFEENIKGNNSRNKENIVKLPTYELYI